MRGSPVPTSPSWVRITEATLLSLLLSVLLIRSCGPGGWGPGARHPYCYTDLGPLYAQRGFAEHAVPYFEAPNEYPVLTGFVAYVASLPVSTVSGFFLVNVMLLGAAAIGISLLLSHMVGPRAAYFALAPTLVLYAFLNWDLMAVLLATAGTYAFLRDQDRWSGILLGSGSAAKMFPAVLVLPFAIDRLARGERRAALRLVLGSGLTWVAVNLPVALSSFEGWSLFFRFSSERPPTWGTLWSVGCRALFRTTWCPGVAVINWLWPVAFLALAGGTWWVARRRALTFPAWAFGLPLLSILLLTAKVYSPQYSLWLLPWFALVLPDVRTFLLFEASDVAVFLTEFSAQGARFGLDPFPRWALDVAVLLRAAALVLIVLAFLRDARAGTLSARSHEIGERLSHEAGGRPPG